MAAFIKKQLIELPRQVIVMDDVAAGLEARIDLVGAPGQPVEPAAEWTGGFYQPVRPLAVGHGQQDQVAHIVRRFNHQPPVHIGFTGPNPGIAGDVARRPLIGQVDPDGGNGGVAVAMATAIVVRHHKVPIPDQAA